MRDVHSHPSVREAEEAFLRKAWWLFPVFGAVVSLVIGGPFWAWVDGLPAAVRWADLLGWRADWRPWRFWAFPSRGGWACG
jgi:hypothetical protein